MISAIICSENSGCFAAVSAHLASLLRHDPHEIIHINDARSLSEGYTRGIARSCGDVLIFCHDDIEILVPDFAPRLKNHLAQFDLVGVVGTSRLISAEWGAAGQPYVFGQVAQLHPTNGFVVCNFGVSGRSAGQIQAVDGLFFAAHRHVAEKVHFDAETFDGFHHYDLDFTFAAHLAGFRVGIANDIPIIHASQGTQDAAWRHYAERFMQKYRGRLPRERPRPISHVRIHAQSKREVLDIMERAWKFGDFKMTISI